MNRREYFNEVFERFLITACGFGMGVTFTLSVLPKDSQPQVEIIQESPEHQPKEPI